MSVAAFPAVLARASFMVKVQLAHVSSPIHYQASGVPEKLKTPPSQRILAINVTFTVGKGRQGSVFIAPHDHTPLRQLAH